MRCLRMNSIRNKQIISSIAKATAIAVMLMALHVTAVFAQHDTGKFQVVAGNGENAFLVNTKTGQVWILTHRTLPTGREPVAIPYKFLMKKPNQEGYLGDELDPSKQSSSRKNSLE